MTLQHPPELFSEILARAAEFAMRRLRLGRVEKRQLTRCAPKSVNHAIESPNSCIGCAEDTARDAPGARPRLNPEPARANFQRIFTRIQRHQFIAEFQKRRAFARRQKARDQSSERLGIVQAFAPRMMVFCQRNLPILQISAPVCASSKIGFSARLRLAAEIDPKLC